MSVATAAAGHAPGIIRRGPLFPGLGSSPGSCPGLASWRMPRAWRGSCRASRAPVGAVHPAPAGGVAQPQNGLPPVPAALLTLMGVSASGYAANKIMETKGSVPT